MSARSASALPVGVKPSKQVSADHALVVAATVVVALEVAWLVEVVTELVALVCVLLAVVVADAVVVPLAGGFEGPHAENTQKTNGNDKTQ